jgi:hypothetical protein
LYILENHNDLSSLTVGCADHLIDARHKALGPTLHLQWRLGVPYTLQLHQPYYTIVVQNWNSFREYIAYIR